MWNIHLTFDCVYCGQKLGEDFAKFLWPSQNIWTLLCNVLNRYYTMYFIDMISMYLPMLRSRRIRRNLLFLDRFWKFQWVLGRRHYFTYWQSNLNLCILLSLKPYLFSQWSLLIGFKRCFFWISCQQLKPLRRTSHWQLVQKKPRTILLDNRLHWLFRKIGLKYIWRSII